SQGNILIGGAGVDTITGGSGRSILIGGAGNDALTDGSGEDILIGGSVGFGANQQAGLEAVLTEWQPTAASPAQRGSNLRAGVGPGSAYQLVWRTTVLDDGASNTLRGSPASTALDWFFTNLGTGADIVPYLSSSDTINNQPTS